MRRYIMCVLCIMCGMSIVLCSGCSTGKGQSLSSQSVTTEGFDLNTAIEMVQKLEKPILDLKSKTVITRSEFDEMHEEYEIFFDTFVLHGFFNATELEDVSKQELEIIKDIRYPTIFDENIEVTKAYIETTVYGEGNSTLTDEKLHIIQESLDEGDDFERSYLFKFDDSKSWRFHRIEGTISYFQ